MRKAGLVVWQAHQAAARILKPGVTTAELNAAYRDTFAEYSATPLFLNYGGSDESPPFPAETCISINEEVVHGIPGPRKIREGEIVSLDTGCKIDGWCGDAAVTHAVGEVPKNVQKLLKVTLDNLNLAIDLLSTESHWSRIARQMQVHVQDSGFSVVEDLTGHGIGQNLHEPPQVPNYWNDDFSKTEDFEIRPGTVIAIEPMVNMGVKDVEICEDDWTMVTADDSPSAHFEHTVAITKDGPVRLTGPPKDDEIEGLPDWLHDRDGWVVW